MTRTVPVREHPARRRLALLLGAAMLGLATLLSASLVWQRRTIELGQRMQPAGWLVSFRPPARWNIAGPLTRGWHDEEYRFVDREEAPDRRELWVGQIRDARGKNGAQLCREAMYEHFQRVASPLRAILIAKSTPLVTASLGPFPGASAVLERSGDLFVGASVSLRGQGTVGYMVEYHTVGPLSTRDLKIGESVVASFEPID